MIYYVFTFGGDLASYSTKPPTDRPYFLTDTIPPPPGSVPFDYILKVNVETEELWWDKVEHSELDPQKEQVIRDQRNALLLECDLTYCNASNWELKSPEEKVEWQIYKQALRDVTEQEGFPDAVVWPTLPGTEVIENA